MCNIPHWINWCTIKITTILYRCDPSIDDCSDFKGAPIDPMRNVTHRDMSKVFTTEQGKAIQSKFDSIARGIKTNSGLGKALVNIQLAPKGVVSMIYPMINWKVRVSIVS